MAFLQPVLPSDSKQPLEPLPKQLGNMHFSPAIGGCIMSSHTYMYNVGVISYKLNFGKKQWLVVWSHVPSPLFFSLPPVSLRTWVESSHQTTFPQMQMFWESEWGPVESLRHSFKLIKLCFGKTQSPNTTVQRLNNCTCNTFLFFVYLIFYFLKQCFRVDHWLPEKIWEKNLNHI